MHQLCYLFRWFHIDSIWVPFFTFRGNSSKPNKFIWRLFTFHLIIRWRRPISNVFATRCRTKTTAIKNWNDCLVCVYRIQRQVITNYHHLYKKEIELGLLLPPCYPIVAFKFNYNYDALWMGNEYIYLFWKYFFLCLLAGVIPVPLQSLPSPSPVRLLPFSMGKRSERNFNLSGRYLSAKLNICSTTTTTTTTCVIL